MSEEEKTLQHIKIITDTIADNISNTPADEILEEVREDHGDTEYEANIMRDIIRKVKFQIKRKAFIKAKQDLNAFKTGHSTSSPTDDIKPDFDEKEFTDTTLAARNGKDISDKDMTGVREDWEDLNKMTSWKSKGDSKKS